MIYNIAPYELIRKDYAGLTRRERLDTMLEIQELIFMQSMEGRAHNGAGAFHKRYYVNTSIDDIVAALDRDKREIKSKRQHLIDEIFGYVKFAISGKPPSRLVNDCGQPLLRIPEFGLRQANAEDVLRGIYIGGLRDGPAARKRAQEKFGVVIGYGSCYFVNLDVMDKLGHNGETLAHQGHEEELDDFKRKGLIVDRGEVGNYDEESIRYLYIRHKVGPGHSDDAAMVVAGLLYNVDVALGVFLGDAIDTFEKYVFDYRDQDCEIAEFIGKNFGSLNVSEDQVYDIAYLAAIPEGMEEELPDSSLRYLLSIDGSVNQTALGSHIRFIMQEPISPMYLAYNRISSTVFYAYLKEKIAAFK